MIQIGFPSAPPCTFSLSRLTSHFVARRVELTGFVVALSLFVGYELQHGLIPANYAMGGNPGGLRRIDAIFGGNGYTTTFTNAPVPFGAFPSLHAGCSTMEALFLSHFFPKGRPFYWCYVLVLYWSTMVRPLSPSLLSPRALAHSLTHSLSPLHRTVPNSPLPNRRSSRRSFSLRLLLLLPFQSSR